MGLLKPQYETYQDVKATLAWWSMPIWSFFAFAMYFFVLSDAHRLALVAAIPGVADWVAKSSAIAIILALGGSIAYFTTHIVELHDKWYDRYIVQWRDNYARTKMIPELLRPYDAKLPRNAVELLSRKPSATLSALFYRFASDRDMTIRKNLVVRFYERITKYWLSQMTEIACLSFIFSAAAYSTLSGAWPAPPPTILSVIVAVGILVAARIVAHHLRRRVWEATRDEIGDIHESHAAEFEQALVACCQENGISIQNKILTP